MSREIKFRAWDHKEKKMIPSIGLTEDGTPFIMKSIYKEKTGEETRKQNASCVAFGNDEVEIMQFTGLKDKNGKEIYEGDVLELHAEFERMNNVWDDDDKTTTVHFGSFSVIFNNDLAAFDLKKIDGNVSGWCLGKENESELEVIGNIYEHPHLLK